MHLKDGAELSAAALHDLLAAISRKYAANQGAGLAFLAESSSSPTRAALVSRLKEKFPGAIWAEYEPVIDEPPVGAARAVFGRELKPVYRFAAGAADREPGLRFSPGRSGGARQRPRIRAGPPGDFAGRGRPDEPAVCGGEHIHASPARWPTTGCASPAAMCWRLPAALGGRVLGTDAFAGLARAST